jgi:hypothetical protein
MFDDSLVEYEMTVLPEDSPVRGNAMFSGDADYDREVEESIIEDLDAGNEWAWCAVKMVARYPGVDNIEGTDYLGQCSYNDEEQFKQPGGYYDDMKAEARADLYNQIESILYRFGCIDPAKHPECTD